MCNFRTNSLFFCLYRTHGHETDGSSKFNRTVRIPSIFQRGRVPEHAPTLEKTVKTAYKVRIHFGKSSAETISGRIKRMSGCSKPRCSRPEPFKPASDLFYVNRKGAEVIPPRLRYFTVLFGNALHL